MCGDARISSRYGDWSMDVRVGERARQVERSHAVSDSTVCLVDRQIRVAGAGVSLVWLAPAFLGTCGMHSNGVVRWTCAEALPAGISRSAEAANPVQTASRNFT